MATTYVEGLRGFNPREGSNQNVIGNLIISPRQLVEFIKANPDCLTDYKEEKQIRVTIWKNDKGLSFTLDKPKEEKKPEQEDRSVGTYSEDLPF